MEKPLKYTLTYNNQATVLEHAPRGWESSNMETERSSTFYGVSRSYTFPLEFVKEGAEILRNAYYSDGIESLVTIKVEKYDYVACTYVTEFEGEINFGVWTDDLVTVKTNAIEGSNHRLLKANENTKYEIAYNKNFIHDRLIQNIYEYSKANIDNTSASWQSGELGYTNLQLNKDAETENIVDLVEVFSPSVTDLRVENYAGPGPLFYNDITGVPDTLILLRATNDCKLNVDIDITIDTDIDFRTPDSSTQTLFITETVDIIEQKLVGLGAIQIVRNNIYTNTVLAEDVSTYNYLNSAVNIQKQIDILVQKGSECYIVHNVSCLITETSLTPERLLNTFSRTATKFDLFIDDFAYKVRCINSADLLNALSLNIFGATGVIESTLLSDKNLIYFSGNSLRGVSGSKLKISLNDLFKSVNSWYNAGLGIQGSKLKVEEKEYFFTDTLLETFENVNNFEIESADDQLYNVVKIGCNSSASEENNGIYEFNSTTQFQMPLTKVAKVYDASSVIRTDSIAMDALRVENNYEENATVDNDNDNELFAVVVIDDSLTDTKALKSDYTVTAGLTTELNDTVFNKSLTPKRSLLRHGNWLRGMLYGQPLTNEIKFLTAQKNAEMISSGLTEKANVKISDLDESLFDPFYFNFVAASKVDTWQKLLNYPERYVEAIVNGKSYKGWIMKATLLEAKRDEIKFKLLGKTPIEIKPEHMIEITVNQTILHTNKFYFQTIGNLIIDIDWGDGIIQNHIVTTSIVLQHDYLISSYYNIKIKITNTENLFLLDMSDNYAINKIEYINIDYEFTNLAFIILRNNNLKSFILSPNINNITTLYVNNNANLEYINTSISNAKLKYIYLQSCKLNVNMINNILTVADSLNLSNGKIYLNGGTNSTPTGAGITAKNNLISRGYTVATN